MKEAEVDTVRPEDIEKVRSAARDLVDGIFTKLGEVQAGEGVRLFFPNGIELIKVKVDVKINPIGLEFLVAVAGEKGVGGVGESEETKTISQQGTLAPTTHEITIAGGCVASPDPICVEAGDKVVWRNQTSGSVTLRLPRIFSPPHTNPPPIPAGGSSRVYTVNGRPGSHKYEYSCLDLSPRSGTINVER